jgi:hypothetical protein
MPAPAPVHPDEQALLGKLLQVPGGNSPLLEAFIKPGVTKLVRLYSPARIQAEAKIGSRFMAAPFRVEPITDPAYTIPKGNSRDGTQQRGRVIFALAQRGEVGILVHVGGVLVACGGWREWH